jgi:hypothetical protein
MISSMDLVGSEVDVVVEDATSASSSSAGAVLRAQQQQQQHQQQQEDAFDSHHSVTPPSGFESLFLPGLRTDTISAVALAAQIHEQHRPLSITGSIVSDYLTADFRTANDNLTADFRTADDGSPETEREDQDADADRSPLVEHATSKVKFLRPQSSSSFSSDTNNNMNNSSSISPFLCSYPEDENPFAKNTPVHARQQPHISYEEFKEDNFQDRTMSEPMNIDAAEKVYDTAKGVWAWGKGIIIFSPFMGIAEGIADKIAETAGSTLAQVDSCVIDKLHSLDDGILNPAVSALVKTVLSAAHQTEDFVKPIIVALLKPIGLIKDTPENTTTTTSIPLKKSFASSPTAPEVTSYAAAAK